MPAPDFFGRPRLRLGPTSWVREIWRNLGAACEREDCLFLETGGRAQPWSLLYSLHLCLHETCDEMPEIVSTHALHTVLPSLSKRHNGVEFV